MTFSVSTEAELLPLAFEMLKAYPDIRIFTLVGDLGAGKTTFVKYVAKALGSTQKPTSPTFSLVNEYPLPNDISMYHMDLYRLEDEEELLNVGFEDYLYANGYCFIEWPEISYSYLSNYVQIQISQEDNGTRIFNFTVHNNF